MKRIITLLICICFALPGHAGKMDKKSSDFVAANMISILYHEFGHALIDIVKLPIYGQEEDAADVLSAVLIHEFFKEDTAVRIARATAFGFLGDKTIDKAERTQPAYWDVHGPDLQRYYTFVCLFYGANPSQRRTIARELRLPDGRAGTCRDEFIQAQNAWLPVIEGLRENGGGRTIRFLADQRTSEFGKLAADIVALEVKELNKDMSLPKRLLVRVEPCDTINAFYDPKSREIIMCTEFAEFLYDVAPK